MAAFIPSRRDPAVNEVALAKVREDKEREARDGFDGTWVAHPDLVPVARDVFDEHQPSKHQHRVRRDDAQVTREDLLAAPVGSISRAGFDGNVEVCVRYLAAWLDGQGCVPIHWLMEDAATAEIARAQLWQWLQAAGDGGHGLHLDDGTPIDIALFERALIGLPSRLAANGAIAGAGKVDAAIALLDALTHRDTLEDFLTIPAYALID
jgi:malate synthase